MSRPFCISNLLFCILACIATSAAAADPEIPGAPQAKPIAIVNATLHPMSSPSIAEGTILFDNGRIVALGTDVEIPANAETIDATGKHVYPSLLDGYSDLGLKEIGNVRATLDQREIGSINPNVQSRVAFNPDSALVPVARANGVLLTLSAPSGGLISGQSSVMQLDGWTWEEMTLQPDVAMHINWPRQRTVLNSGDEGSSRGTDLEELEQLFETVKDYRRARENDEQFPIDLRWEAMLPVLAGKQPVIISADRSGEIQSAVAFARRHGLRIILLGGYDAVDCAELLKQEQVPVMVAAVYRLPRRRDDAYDAAYTLANRLREAGVTFCITSSGRSNAANVRNLPYHAATAAAYGLPIDEALKAITLYPAQILGVADRVGSLEPGKDATLFVSDGNPLETPTQIERAFIQGRTVQLSSRHTRLYDKYRTKYERQQQQ